MVRLRLSARDARRAVLTSVRAEVDCPKGTPGGKDNTTMFTYKSPAHSIWCIHTNIPNAIYLHVHDMVRPTHTHIYGVL